MSDIEICYFGDNGKPSLVYRPNCLGTMDARRQALQHVSDKFRSAEIWNGLECIETIILKHAA